jgi:hypothetical protein
MGAKKTFKGVRKFLKEYEPWVNGLPDTPPDECGFMKVPHKGSGAGFDPACSGPCPNGGECSKIIPHGEMDKDGDLVITFECTCPDVRVTN